MNKKILKIYNRLLMVLLTMAVCGVVSSCSKDSTKDDIYTAEGRDSYDMYSVYYVYSDRQGMYWLMEERTYEEMISPEEMIRTLIEENYVSNDMELLDFWMDGKVAYVDLSNLERGSDGYGRGDLGLTINLYTIVNNLCINKAFGIEGVRFLDSHELKPTLDEFFDNTEPFESTFELQGV